MTPAKPIESRNLTLRDAVYLGGILAAIIPVVIFMAKVDTRLENLEKTMSAVVEVKIKPGAVGPDSVSGTLPATAVASTRTAQ